MFCEFRIEEIDIAATLDTYARRKENDQRRQKTQAQTRLKARTSCFLRSDLAGAAFSASRHGTHLTLAGEPDIDNASSQVG
jgi:hypothetical protein